MKAIIIINFAMCAIMAVMALVGLALGRLDLAIVALTFAFLNLGMVYIVKRHGY